MHCHRAASHPFKRRFDRCFPRLRFGFLQIQKTFVCKVKCVGKTLHCFFRFPRQVDVSESEQRPVFKNRIEIKLLLLMVFLIEGEQNRQLKSGLVQGGVVTGEFVALQLIKKVFPLSPGGICILQQRMRIQSFIAC